LHVECSGDREMMLIRRGNGVERIWIHKEKMNPGNERSAEEEAKGANN